MDNLYPILEYDPCREAVIEPTQAWRPGVEIPERAVLCWFHDVITKLVEEGTAREIHTLGSEMGRHPIYELTVNGTSLALFHPCIGGPMAAAFLEEVIAYGCRKFVACGACGVLDSGIALGHVLLPTSAVRDEGTSYHYLPPSPEVAATPSAVESIERTLRRVGIDYIKCKTWTTDAPYRETRDKVNRRLAQGCLTVEMEAAALFAVAQFRNMEFGQILFAGDDLSGEEWDEREYTTHTSAREKILWLAAECCAEM